jgi:hypothetical protein
MDLVTRVAALSDLVAVDVCQRLAADLLRRPGPSLEEAAAALPAAFTADVDFPRMFADLDESYYTKLPPDLSVRLAREILANAATDPALAATLAPVLDAYRDTRQFAVEVLALGAAFSMVILSATVTYEDGKAGKKALTPELAKALTGWFTSLKPWAPRGLAE